MLWLAGQIAHDASVRINPHRGAVRHLATRSVPVVSVQEPYFRPCLSFRPATNAS
jgi:hypothetical protein